ncbi:MAG: prepilin-type N-terminal cleavage/methylation domain-containing protein [Desulfosarcinaceae bacterium]|nr:prepilin-type N-terminal cleavage/methylation domain-containing protein [Desulfosarcinaceae bacterium]
MGAERGFTLLEVILALVLTGILTAMVATSAISGFNFFAAARDNIHITQKANLALARLTREFREITNIIGVDTTRPYLIYDRAAVRNAIALDAGDLKFYADVGGITSMNAAYIAANGDVLIDAVTGFSLNFLNGTTNWQVSPTFDPIRELSAIGFQITIGRESFGGRASTFQNTVHLRNNNNYGGASLAVTPPTPPTQGAYPCFIGAAQTAAVAPNWRHLSLLAMLLLPVAWLRRRTASPLGVLTVLLRDMQGAALITIVGILVVFSALALVMLPMITTSQYTQLDQDAASKTYYLAESGYRYAASQYLNAGSDAAKNAALENLHGQTYSLAGNAGSFQVSVFPYYGYVSSDPGGSTTLTIRVPGGLSADLDASAFAGGGRLRIGSAVFAYSSASPSPPNISFSMTSTMPSVPVNTNVYFMGRTSAAAQTVVQDGTINMASGTTRTFPLENAEVIINGNLYAYRQNNRTTDQLVGITDPEDPNMPALNLAPGTDVVLGRYVDLQSTGSFGSGGLASQRLLTYHVPLPSSENARHRLEFHDRFEDLSHWSTIWGGQAAADIGGDSAMAITAVDTYTSGWPRISMTALDWTTTELDLEWIHQRADYFLSYDAQVKIGFEGSPTPDWGFTPPGSDIPTYFAAGLSFRLDSATSSFNAYGLSLMRGNNAAPDPFDNLPNELLDADFNSKLIILLWQQTGDGTSRTWLAYEEIADLTQFEENVEGGVNGWTADGLWNISTNRHFSGSSSWYYGQSGTNNYDTGAINSGSLVSPEIDLAICDYGRLILSYRSLHQTQPIDPDLYDLKTVEIRMREGGTWSAWTEIDRITGASSGWNQREVDITAYLGEQIQLRYHFDTVTDLDNNFEGWYIDDVRIAGDWPIQESTLALRIQEAPSLRFTNGGTYAIQRGDQVFQGTASAVVDADPILTGGSWAGGNASGHLILKNLSGSFNLSQPFFVIAQGQVGTVQEVRSRDNFIRAYYGSPLGCGTANSDPLDNQRLANPRDPTELNWPPEEGEPYTAADDAFTLIQWDASNVNASVASFTRLNTTQLRSDEPALLTPNGPLGQTRPELGLHALGKGAENTYFDDFGLTVTFDGPLDITSPVQE